MARREVFLCCPPVGTSTSRCPSGSRELCRMVSDNARPAALVNVNLRGMDTVYSAIALGDPAYTVVGCMSGTGGGLLGAFGMATAEDTAC